jgi:hypothetical protein
VTMDPGDEHRVPVEGGKYTLLVRAGDYRVHFLRHGEPWRGSQFGDPVHALRAAMCELDAARVVVHAVRQYQDRHPDSVPIDVAGALARHDALTGDREPPSPWASPPALTPGTYYGTALQAGDETLAATGRSPREIDPPTDSPSYRGRSGSDVLAPGPDLTPRQMLDDVARALGWRTDFACGDSPITWDLALGKIAEIARERACGRRTESLVAPVGHLDQVERDAGFGPGFGSTWRAAVAFDRAERAYSAAQAQVEVVDLEIATELARRDALPPGQDPGDRSDLVRRRAALVADLRSAEQRVRVAERDLRSAARQFVQAYPGISDDADAGTGDRAGSVTTGEAAVDGGALPISWRALRALLDDLARDPRHEAALDRAVVLRLEDDDHRMYVGSLVGVSVDADADEAPELVLDGEPAVCFVRQDDPTPGPGEEEP